MRACCGESGHGMVFYRHAIKGNGRTSTTGPMLDKIEFVVMVLKPAQTASVLLCPEETPLEPREWLSDKLVRPPEQC